MVPQSHAGEIELLCARPKDWPSGKVIGLRARGGFAWALAWRDGKVTRYRIASREEHPPVKVRVNAGVKAVEAEKP